MATCRGQCLEPTIELANQHSDPKWSNSIAGFPGSDSPGWSVQLKCANTNARPKSFWHDIPLKVGDNYRFVCEIPMGTCQKNEVMTKVEGNPLMMDSKKDLPRYNKMGKYPAN